MRAQIDTDFQGYATAVLPWLTRDPVTNNVAYTLVEQRLAGAVPVEPDALWLRVYDGDDLIGVALRTPPWGLLVSPMPPAAVLAVAGALTAAGVGLPSVNGPVEVAAGVAEAYATATGTRAVPGTTSRLYRLGTLTPPAGVPGSLREATAADRDLLLAWTHDFVADVDPDSTAQSAREVDGRLPRGGLIWLWEDAGEPVSMAWLSRPAAGAVRVSGVYTPPPYRRRGYAAAVTAAVSAVALERGATACLLFTDLANPTSNAIYQRLGYRPDGDWAQWRFDPAPATASDPAPATADPAPPRSEAAVGEAG